jgi:hypothetical protein
MKNHAKSSVLSQDRQEPDEDNDEGILTPSPRSSEGLKRCLALVGPLPFVPDGLKTSQLMEWCEDLRDWCEQRREYGTVEFLLSCVTHLPKDYHTSEHDHIRQIIKDLYEEDYEIGTDAPGSYHSEPCPGSW